jgi:CxxC motif-containing protein (DUF1111 family)
MLFPMSGLKTNAFFLLYQMQACRSCHILSARMHNQSYERKTAVCCILRIADFFRVKAFFILNV